MATINIVGTGGIIEGNLGAANVNVNLDPVYGNFNGTTSSVNAGSPTMFDDIFNGAGTIMAWIYPKSVGETAGRIYDKDKWALTMSDAANVLEFSVVHSTTTGVWKTGAVVPFNAWTHVAVVYDGSSVSNDPTIYINGVASTIANETTPVGTRTSDASDDLFIGNRADGARTFDGYIMDAKIYKASGLSSTQVPIAAAKINQEPDLISPNPPKGWYKFNASTTADSSGNSNTASASNMGSVVYDAFSVDVQDNSTTTDGTFTVTQGKVEGLALTSLAFDGGTSHVDLASSFTMSHDGSTVAFWVKKDNATGNIDTILGQASDANQHWIQIKTNGEVVMRDYPNDLGTTSQIADTNWNHVIITMNGDSNGAIYFNGVSQPIDDNDIVGDPVFDVMGIRSTVDELDAKLRDVKVFDYALSAEQAASLYSGTYPQTPKHWWKIDEGTGTAVEDYGTGTDADGTIDGATYSNGTLDLDGNLTIAANGTLSAPRGNLALSANIDNDGTFTNNNGKLLSDGATYITGDADPVFYDFESTSGQTRFQINITIENNLTTSGSASTTYIWLGTTLTMGTATSAATLVHNKSTFWFYAYAGGHLATLQGASALYPVQVQGSVGTFNFGGDGGIAQLSNVDFQRDITTDGVTDHIKLTGDCEFDAVTVNSGDTLDLNGQRAVFGGAFDLTTGALAMNDSMAVFTNTIDFNGRVPTSNTGTTIIHDPPSAGEKLITSLYFGGTFFAKGVESDVNGYAWGGSSGEYPAKIFVGGQLDCQQNVKTGHWQVATGGEVRGNDRTLTAEGDLTMSGGLIGKSALNLTGAEEVTGSDNLDEVATTNKFTIEAWFKASTDANYRAIFSRGTSWSTGNLYVYMNSDGYVQASANDLGNTLTSTTAGLADDKWHHVAYTYDTTTISLYIDGKLEATAASTAGINTQTAGFKIGDRDGDNWIGNIGRVSVWKNALSETLIRKMLFMDWTTMAADSDFTDSDAIGWWQFDEGTGTAVEDLSSQSNDGTLNSAAWAGGGTFTYGTSTVDMIDDGTILLATGVNSFNNLNVAASGKTTTLSILAGASDIRFFGTLTHGGGTASSSGNPAWTMRGSSTVSAGSDWTGWYLCYWSSSAAVPASSWEYWIALTDSTLAGDMTCTGYFRPHQSVVNSGEYTITTYNAIFSTTGGLNMGNGSLIFTHAQGLSDTASSSVFTAGPGATVTGVAAKSTFKSQNNFVVVGNIENLNVTNEELSILGNVTNCTGDVHRWNPTIDTEQMLDADTADDRDVRLGSDLDRNTELVT